MGNNKASNYYEIALALPAMWKQNVYTYSAEQPLAIGSIVTVPFGTSERIGIVTSRVDKPDYETKLISLLTEYILPKTTQKFLHWITEYYPGAPGAHIQHFAPTFLRYIPKPRNNNPKPAKPSEPKRLTKEQQLAFSKLNRPSSSKTNVLHGITGSGKTRLYCELARKSLSEGKNVLILYPEISLTTQLEQTLVEFFGADKVAVYHSKRTPAQQRRTWIGTHNSEDPKIIIGPRSALFLPHANLGLIIVDEAHDGAYKQDSGNRYSGLVVAGALAKKHNAQLILGSATPPVQETEQILSKGGSLVCMHSLAKDNHNNTKNFNVVDMTKKENHAGSHLLSKALLESVRVSLQNRKQSLLFLNKRGTARMLLCENCGWHAECPRCEMPLTHHHDSFSLQCHICGLKQKSIISCPDCNDSLSLKNPGIKAIEQDIKDLFPDATIARFDSDNKKKDTFSENYEYIRSGGADIIIGTQLLTKGLDLPLLDTVGILQADSALLLPDYTSEERSFQQLTQVSGRVGRGHQSGTIIVQTYQPSSYIFPYVLSQNWHGFYDQELQKRRLSNYPPFSYAMKVWVSKNTREAAVKSVTSLSISLQTNKNVRVLGPAPSYYEKISGKYSWQLIITSSYRPELSSIAKKLKSDFYFDLDPTSFL